MVKFKRGKKYGIFPAGDSRGAALIVVIFAMMLFSGLSWGLFNIQSADMESNVRLFESERALYAAEAGAQWASRMVAINPGFRTDTGHGYAAGYAYHLLSGAEYQIVVRDSSGTETAGSVVVESTGFIPSTALPLGKRAVKMFITPVQRNVYQSGLFASESMVLNGNVTVDSYNSDNGLPGTGNSTHNGDVGSNGTITANGSVSIDGDVAWGSDSGDKFVKNGSVTISGTQAKSESDIAMDTVDVPEVLSSLSDSGNLVLNGSNKTYTLSTGNYKYSSITLNGSYTLVMDGAVNLYLTGSLIVNGSSQIVIPYGCGPVNIYSGGNVTFNGVVNNTNATDALFIYGTSTSSQSITFNGNIPFFGTIYAPAATVTVNGNNSIYGVAAAKKIVINGNGTVHYDETLAALGGGGSSAGFSSWQEQ